jgi:hypothetical protein
VGWLGIQRDQPASVQRREAVTDRCRERAVGGGEQHGAVRATAAPLEARQQGVPIAGLGVRPLVEHEPHVRSTHVGRLHGRCAGVHDDAPVQHLGVADRVEPVDAHPTRGRTAMASQQIDEHAERGGVAANDGEAVAARDREVETVEHPTGAGLGDHALEQQHGRGPGSWSWLHRVCSGDPHLGVACFRVAFRRLSVASTPASMPGCPR